MMKLYKDKLISVMMAKTVINNTIWESASGTISVPSAFCKGFVIRLPVNSCYEIIQTDCYGDCQFHLVVLYWFVLAQSS